MRAYYGFVLFLAATAAMAQPARSGRLNPPHLLEMPLVERVMREITAINPQDAAARRMGVFEQLNEIIGELSSGRAALGGLTPDEARIMQEYRDARLRAMEEVYRGPQDDELLPALRRFDDDPALREEILNKFFSPALRTQSAALSRQLQAGQAVLRQQNVAFGGQAAPRAPAAAAVNPAPAKPAAAAPKAPLPPDPSIAKARAAGVDTKVFGMQLGDRISLPSCSMMDVLLPSNTCVIDGDIGAVASTLAGMIDPKLGDIVSVKLGRENCPNWISDCLVLATVEGERLIGVTVHPDGPSVEQATARELRGKYGNRLTDHQRFITPTNGNGQFEVHDLEWELPGLYVQYRPVHASIFKGVIYIETDRAHQLRLAGERETNRPKL